MKKEILEQVGGSSYQSPNLGDHSVLVFAIYFLMLRGCEVLKYYIIFIAPASSLSFIPSPSPACTCARSSSVYFIVNQYQFSSPTFTNAAAMFHLTL